MSGLEKLKESLTRALLEEMAKQKLLQEDVAINTKFTPADISKILGKKKNCTLKTLDELASGVNCEAKIVFIPKENEKK